MQVHQPRFLAAAASRRARIGFRVSAVVGLLIPALTIAQEAAPTRIAVLNVGQVYSKYQKAIDAKKELELAVQPFKAIADKLKNELTKLQQAATDARSDTATKNAATQQALVVRRKLEDLEAEARTSIGKKSEQSLVEIYSEIQAAAGKLADARNFDLVLIYSEALNKDDLLSFANITRKIQAADQGGFVPVFIRSRIDITDATLNVLNQGYVKNKSK